MRIAQIFFPPCVVREDSSGSFYTFFFDFLRETLRDKNKTYIFAAFFAKLKIMDKVRAEAVKRSANWWYCDNVVSKPGQLGLLHMGFPRVFILVRDGDELVTTTFEKFKAGLTEVNFLDPSEREGTDIDALLIDAWNFTILAEEYDERMAEEWEDLEDLEY